jgi:hypothetical protein
MPNAFTSFDKRLSKIDHTRQAMARGYTSFVGSDGLIVIRPRRRPLRLPIKGIALMALGFFGLKGMMLAQIGLEGYSERLTTLQNGTLVEQAGAWIMQVEPATQWIASNLGPILH